MSPLRLAKLSLSRHRLSTAITVLAIALSVACGGILLRLYDLSQSRFSSMGTGGDAIIGAKAGGIEILLGSLNGEGPFPDFLPAVLLESLRTEPHVQILVPFVYFGKYGEDRVIGTDETFYKNSVHPLSLSAGDWFGAAGEVVVGASVAREQNIRVGDMVPIQPWLGEEGDFATFQLRVKGILSPTNSVWDRSLFSSIEQAHQVFAQYPLILGRKSVWGNQVLNYFIAYLKPLGFHPLEAIVNRRTVGQIVNVQEQKEKLQELTGVGKSLGLFVTIFVLLLGGLSVCSMLVTRFEGMSIQLAVLNAIGYTKKEISRWLLWEGFFLGVMGVALGAIIDALAFPLLRSLLGTALPPPELAASSIFNSAIVWGVAILATVASVIVPILRIKSSRAGRGELI